MVFKKGFTLAEVLITLGIIGVVAAITIPILLNNYKEGQYNTYFKKGFSVLSQAVLKLQVDGEEPDLSSSALLLAQFGTVINFSKTDTCVNIYQTSRKFYKGIVSDGLTYPGSAAVLQDGSFFSIPNVWRSSTCTSANLGSGIGVCAELDIDANGTKEPNMYGQDMYIFWLAKKGTSYIVLPRGYGGIAGGCSPNSTDWGTSAGCAFMRLTNPNNMP